MELLIKVLAFVLPAAVAAVTGLSCYKLGRIHARGWSNMDLSMGRMKIQTAIASGMSVMLTTAEVRALQDVGEFCTQDAIASPAGQAEGQVVPRGKLH